jgi:hypothetical protein
MQIDPKTTFRGPALKAAYDAILKERRMDDGRQPCLAPSVGSTIASH